MNLYWKKLFGKLEGKSYNNTELLNNPRLELDYLVATPRMAHYIKYSSNIYNIYLKYVAADDIHVYSIDEVFMDITNYLNINKITPHDFAMKIIKDVLKETGVTATAGIGSNMYLAKVAMDIVAKKMKPDNDGVRIAFDDGNVTVIPRRTGGFKLISESVNAECAMELCDTVYDEIIKLGNSQ
jgi:hypothetical protein